MHTQDKYSTATAAWWIWVFRIKKLVAKDLCDKSISQDRKIALEEMIWLDSFYHIEFKHDSDITERVIFPISDSESRGIEDARFVRFLMIMNQKE
jgi:hypothetical protein